MKKTNETKVNNKNIDDRPNKDAGRWEAKALRTSRQRTVTCHCLEKHCDWPTARINRRLGNEGISAHLKDWKGISKTSLCLGRPLVAEMKIQQSNG